MSGKISILDSVLREGAQSEGVSFTVQDKLNIALTLDSMGIRYIEAGNPASNPKDMDFFREAKKLSLKNAEICAFGATRRRDAATEEDENVRALLAAGTGTVVVFGKAWDFHVAQVLKATLRENLDMIRDTVRFLRRNGRKVIFDAEHFFDGMRSDREYALEVLKTAAQAGASIVTLCDTNGGSLFFDVAEMTAAAVGVLDGVETGIHTHNDSGLAVSNTIAAVRSGALHVQGTVGGMGERCGNANLSVVIPDLQIKMGYECIPDGSLHRLTRASRRIAEICNITLRDSMPYVGTAAFAHKAGMHIDGIMKSHKTFEHVDPELVGNERRMLISEVGGRSSVLPVIQRILPGVTKDSPQVQRVLDAIKEYERRGYQFESAEASFELLIRKTLGLWKPFFDLGQFKIIEEQNHTDAPSADAMIKVMSDGREEITAAQGNGPVHALDRALRKALEVFYPQLRKVQLTDYKVRVIDSRAATGARVRVLIESTDGDNYWTTLGVSQDVINASFLALTDSIEYKLLRDSMRETYNDTNMDI